MPPGLGARAAAGGFPEKLGRSQGGGLQADGRVTGPRAPAPASVPGLGLGEEPREPGVFHPSQSLPEDPAGTGAAAAAEWWPGCSSARPSVLAAGSRACRRPWKPVSPAAQASNGSSCPVFRE